MKFRGKLRIHRQTGKGSFKMYWGKNQARERHKLKSSTCKNIQYNKLVKHMAKSEAVVDARIGKLTPNGKNSKWETVLVWSIHQQRRWTCWSAKRGGQSGDVHLNVLRTLSLLILRITMQRYCKLLPIAWPALFISTRHFLQKIPSVARPFTSYSWEMLTSETVNRKQK